MLNTKFNIELQRLRDDTVLVTPLCITGRDNSALTWKGGCQLWVHIALRSSLTAFQTLEDN